MKNKKNIITILFIIVTLIVLSVPIMVGAAKEKYWQELKSDSKFSESENTNDSNLVVESEITPEEKAMYEKWAKENEIALQKDLLVEDLLNQYYFEEYQIIQSIKPDRSSGPIELTLTEFDVKRTELIVKLYKKQNLNKNEKEACKHQLEIAYKKPYNKIQLSNTLKKDIEKIIK